MNSNGYADEVLDRNENCAGNWARGNASDVLEKNLSTFFLCPESMVS